MRPYVLILLSLLLLCYMIHAIPRLDYSERYPPPRDLEKRKACLNNCAENAVNALVVVVCQRGCEPVDWRPWGFESPIAGTE